MPRDYKVIVVYKAPSGRAGRRTTWRSTLQSLVDKYAARGCTEFAWRAFHSERYREIKPRRTT